MSRPVDQCVVESSKECVYEGHTVPTNKTEQLRFKETFSPEYLYPSDLVLYFCGHHPECSKLGSSIALQLAKHNVDNNFAVVGVLEHLTETMAVLEHTLPQFFTGVSEVYRQQETGNNVNKNTVKSSNVSDHVRAVLRQRLSNEYELYEYIKQKLFRQFNNIVNP